MKLCFQQQGVGVCFLYAKGTKLRLPIGSLCILYHPTLHTTTSSPLSFAPPGILKRSPFSVQWPAELPHVIIASSLKIPNRDRYIRLQLKITRLTLYHPSTSSLPWASSLPFRPTLDHTDAVFNHVDLELFPIRITPSSI